MLVLASKKHLLLKIDVCIVFAFSNCSFSTSFIFLALRKTIINHNKEGGLGVNRRFEQALQKNHIGTKIR
jgi:hypothetical protein